MYGTAPQPRVRPGPVATVGPVCRGALTVWVLWLAAATLLWPHDAAARRVRIQARAHISLQAGDDPAGGRLWVSGRLVDARGQGVANQSVSVTVRAADTAPGPQKQASTEVRTGAGGAFRATFPRAQIARPEGPLKVEATSFGSDTHAGTTATQRFDLAQATGEIALEVEPLRLTTDLDLLRVAVFAGVDGNPLAGRNLEITIDGRARLKLVTGQDGWAETQVTTATLLPIGTHRVGARMAETRAVSAAQAEVAVQVVKAVTVTLTQQPASTCPDDRLCVQGRVQAHDGRGHLEPVSGAAVMLDADRTRLGHVISDDLGRFAVALRTDSLLERFAPGPLATVALADVPAAYHQTGLSDVLVLDLPPPPSLSHWLYLGVLALLAGALVWRRWQDRRRERRLAEQLAAVSAGLPTQAYRRVGAGGSETSFVRGRVVHGETGAAVSASLSLRRREEPGRVDPESTRPAELSLTAPDGRFEVGPLAAGLWEMWVQCAEHETLHIEVEIPHDGTFDGCELLPRSNRAVARSAFSRVVQRLTGSPVDWARETPQDAEPRWLRSARRGHREVRTAVQTMDRAAYGARTDAEVVAELHRALTRAEEAGR